MQSINKYTAYKPSGIPRLGVVPKRSELKGNRLYLNDFFKLFLCINLFINNICIIFVSTYLPRLS